MDQRDSVARELKILMNKVNRKAESCIPPELKREATEMQGRVLGYLFHNRERPVFQRDVEAEFSITRATASKMLTLMEKNGMITRSGVAGDARLKKLELTEKSLVHMKKIRQGMLDFEHMLLQGFTPEEKASLLFLLRKVEKNVE